MSTYRELVYLVLDELKLVSDDSTFTEDHVVFLLNRYRTFLLKQRYSDIKKQIPDSNYQSIYMDLIQVPAISGEPCEGGTYLRSSVKVPIPMQIGSPKVTPMDYYQGEITYVSRERMRYVGYNRFLPNIIYCSIGPDQYLYFKSFNPQYLYLEKVKFTGVFENAEKASELECGTSDICDILDKEFPIEDSLISPLIELVLKELAGPAWKPQDDTNNASDDLANLANFIRRSTKNNVQKQIED